MCGGVQGRRGQEGLRMGESRDWGGGEGEGGVEEKGRGSLTVSCTCSYYHVHVVTNCV